MMTSVETRQAIPHAELPWQIAPDTGERGALVQPGGLAAWTLRMRDAVCHAQMRQMWMLLEEMQRAGVRAVDIADRCVPDVARALGSDWLADRLSFAEVTLACGRLKALLQHLDAQWSCPPRRGGFGTGRRLLVLVPQGEQHTFGAQILAGQLRRAGCHVRLCMGAEAEGCARGLLRECPGGVLISASRWQSLDFLCSLVTDLRRADEKLPVVIGGNILDLGSDVHQRVGADFAANDWRDALASLGRWVAP